MSANRLRAWLLYSNSFCFCIPVRAGFLLMSVLTCLLSGAIAVTIWFEISHSYELSTRERVVFIVTGILESLLCIVSAIGFIGVVARKQSFVTMYTYFLYLHFVINLVVGIYFLVVVRARNRQELIDYCAQVFVDTSLESRCSDLMSVSTYVFIVIVAALLLLELYGTLIAARYVHRLRMQKRDDRSRRLGYFHALSQPETLSKHARQASDDIELLHSREESDPWDLGDPVLGLEPQSYMPVSTHDRDPSPPPPSPPSHSLSDTISDGRVRALPIPPVPDVKPAQPGMLPNPYDHTVGEDEQHSVHSTDVSTSAHFALMDYGTYMGSVFTTATPAPKYSR